MSNIKLGSAQSGIASNVRVRVLDSNTKKIKYDASERNLVSKLGIFGIARFISGGFNQSSPDVMEEYLPRYIAVGSNIPASTSGGSVSTIVSINDPCLLSELTVGGLPKRVEISNKPDSQVPTNANYVKVVVRSYVPSNLLLDGSSLDSTSYTIGELGLFTRSSGNNLWARVVLNNPVTITTSDTLEIIWEITILSVHPTNYPEELNILETSLYTLFFTYDGRYIENDIVYDVNNNPIQYLIDDVFYDQDMSSYELTAFSIVNAGNNYQLNDKILIQTGDLSDKSAVLTVVGVDNGHVTALEISIKGKFLTNITNPTYSAVGGSGTGLVLNITTDYTKTRTQYSYDPISKSVLANNKFTGLFINDAGKYVIPKNQHKISYEILPTDATDQSVNYISNNNCTYVNDTGIIYGVEEGTSQITISTVNGLVETLDTEVQEWSNQVLPESVVISGYDEPIQVGSTLQLEGAVQPDNAVNTTVRWVSMHPENLLIDDTGLVLALTASENNEVRCYTYNNKYSFVRITVIDNEGDE